MLIYFPVAFFIIHEGVSSSIVVACVTQQTGLAFEARSSLRRAGAVLCFAFVPQQFLVLFCFVYSSARRLVSVTFFGWFAFCAFR